MRANYIDVGLQRSQEKSFDIEKTVEMKTSEGEITPFKAVGGTSSVSAEDVLSQPRNFLYLEVVQKGDVLSEMDKQIIERQHQRIEEEIREEKQKDEVVKDEKKDAKEKPTLTPAPDKLVAILTKCYITGCVCHTINRSGSIIKHYSESELQIPASRLSKGYALWKKHQNCSCVEIYTRHITVINGSESLVFKE